MAAHATESVSAGSPSSSHPSSERTTHVPPLHTEMPDDGPRFNEGIRGPEGVLFQRAVDAYRAEDMPSAEQGFRKITEEFPGSRVRSACRAFLAEITARSGTDHHRSQAIEQYRALIRDDPASENAARARWRVADLYADAGWLVEARAAYEHAAVSKDWDRARALLGLGMVLMRRGQWKEAEAAFRDVIGSTDDGRLLAPATFALADAFYAERRMPEARAVYQAARRQWPMLFRQRPRSILTLATLNAQRNAWTEARALYLLFYNLYPQDPEAASGLIRIGDSWRREGRLDTARMIYGAVISTYSGTPHEALGTMRLVELGRAMIVRHSADPLAFSIGHQFDIGPRVPLEVHDQAATLRTIAKQHAEDATGSEALFHLGELFESLGQASEAAQVFQELSDRRAQALDDSWPVAGGERLTALLRPWITAALRAYDDLTALMLFYRHGRYADQLYAGTDILVRVADAHRRSGFAPQAVRLYQSLLHHEASSGVQEQALLGLGLTYVDQNDLPAARRVFERYLLQYPGAGGKPVALKFLAMTLHRLGDDTGAVRVVKQWLRFVREDTHPDRGTMLMLLAEAHAGEGNRRDAVHAFAKAERHGGLPIVARLRYADTLAASGEVQPALAQYQRLVRSPSGSDAEWSVIRMVQLNVIRKQYDEARDVARRWQDTSGDDFVRRVADLLVGAREHTASGG